MGRRRLSGAGEDVTIDVVLIGGACVGLYFLVVKPLLGNLGLSSDSPNVKAEKALPGSSNPFNYQFQPFVDFYNQNTPQITTPGTSSGFFSNLWNDINMSQPVTTDSAPTVQQFFQALYQNPTQASPWYVLDTVDLSSRAMNLYNALSVSALNPFSTSDQQGGLSALSGLSNQLQVAFIANFFWWNYNVDLLTFLSGSITNPGLTPANLSQVVSTVNSLPVNP